MPALGDRAGLAADERTQLDGKEFSEVRGKPGVKNDSWNFQEISFGIICSKNTNYSHSSSCIRVLVSQEGFSSSALRECALGLHHP